MAKVTRVVEVPGDIESTFDYLADFATTEEWDPGVLKGERLSDPAVGQDAEFKITVSFMGKQQSLIYKTVEYDRPNRVVLDGRNAASRSYDVMTFAPSSHGGTRITYDAELTLNGPARFLDFGLKPIFDKLADKAVAGMADTLDGAVV